MKKKVNILKNVKASTADGGYQPNPGAAIPTGKLYVVSTPIGNIEDITYRAVRVLSEIDLIAAEDTRKTRILLSYYKISKPLTSYHEHNKHFKGKEILNQLLSGKNVALTSDAGTPGISDPGYSLVNLAINNDVEVVPIPGSTALIAALSVSGLPTDHFVYEGFLPPKGAKRDKALLKFLQEERTVIFYESPHRFKRFLEDVFRLLGDRKLVVARELTKMFEEVVRGRVQEIMEYYEDKTIRGEFTIILGGVERNQQSDSERENG